MAALVWAGLGILTLAVLVLAALQLRLLGQSGRALLRLEKLESRSQAAAADRPAPASPAQSPEEAARAATALGSTFRPGADAPPFVLPDRLGRPHALRDWLGERVLLVFLSAETAYGREAWRVLASATTYRRPGWPRIVVVDVAPEASAAFAERVTGSPLVVLRNTGTVARDYFVDVTPVAFLIDEQGKILRSRIAGVQPISAMAGEPPSTDDALAGGRRRTQAAIAGKQAPTFELPTLGDGPVSLEAFRGRPALLVFVDPGCAASREVVGWLGSRSWNDAETALIVVSRGAEAVSRAWFAEHQAIARIALQADWEVSRLYGPPGTPVGVLVDARGIVTGEPSRGARAVGQLLASVSTTSRPGPVFETGGSTTPA